MALSVNEIVSLLNASGSEQAALHEEAVRLRNATFGPKVIRRGVIEITNACRVNCEYCPMRRDNAHDNNRYSLTGDEILAAASAIRDSGIDIVFLQGGEVPQTTELVCSVIPSIRDLFSNRVEILLCLGIKSPAEYARLRELGATSYILKHETSDPILHQRTRGESLERRLDALKALLNLGYKVGTGTIVGLPGQSQESLANDILLAEQLGVHMCSASPFIPADGTPLSEAEAGSVDVALNAIAIMRRVNPGWLIPSVSALEQRKGGGQLAGLNAGANVMTVNFTPNAKRSDYLIYGPDRHVVKLGAVTEQMRSAGVSPGMSLWSGIPDG